MQVIEAAMLGWQGNPLKMIMLLFIPRKTTISTEVTLLFGHMFHPRIHPVSPGLLTVFAAVSSTLRAEPQQTHNGCSAYAPDICNSWY